MMLDFYVQNILVLNSQKILFSGFAKSSVHAYSISTPVASFISRSSYVAIRKGCFP